MKRWIVRLLLGGVALFLVACALTWWTATPDIGAKATGERLTRMQASPQWKDGIFDNELPRVDGPMDEMLEKEFSGASEHQVPEGPLPVVQRTGAELAQLPASGLRVTWLGHSTLLVEIDGLRVLMDPVWAERVSPWESIGPSRFFEPPLALDELPPIDAVLISHDHFDHLDYATVIALKDRDLRWLVPLGIGAHLEHWGVPVDQIEEMDWWEDRVFGEVRITATPARHFSGRWLDRLSSTLWVGWAINGPEHDVFYSGDTSLHPELVDIGERLGPFDLTMMDAGAYDSTWTDVHLGPEQTVVAHRMVKGDLLLPVHWGLFDLGNHGWTEPMERVQVAAERFGVRVVSPKPGESVELSDVGPSATTRWWPAVPWVPLADDPVWSTSIDEVLDRWWGPR